MKPIKLGTMAVAAALALGAFGVKAAPTTTTDYAKLSVSLTVNQQALYDTNKNGDGKTYIYTIQKTKIGNKELLKILAEMFDTTWPAGAQLEYDYYSGQVIVADKTGTNILFFCNTGVNTTNRSASLHLGLFENSGPESGKYVDATPGSESFTSYYRGHISLHYDIFSDETVYTDLNGYGLTTEKYTDKWTSTTDSWSETDTYTPVANGYAGDEDAIMTGKITGKGKGKSTGPI